MLFTIYSSGSELLDAFLPNRFLLSFHYPFLLVAFGSFDFMKHSILFIFVVATFENFLIDCPTPYTIRN